jgi:hypothetical protein
LENLKDEYSTLEKENQQPSSLLRA